jgi:hypothetical protein
MTEIVAEIFGLLANCKNIKSINPREVYFRLYCSVLKRLMASKKK